MRMIAAVLAALALAACAAVPAFQVRAPEQPLAPDATVALAGAWRIAALDGVPTPEPARSFNFHYARPIGWAQFGCNGGNGAAVAENGWFVAGDWIITAAGCRSDDVARLERKGFEILARPLAIERVGARRVRLRNERGSILLERQPLPPQLAGTRWAATQLGPQQLGPRQRVVLRFLEREWRAGAGCNEARGVYAVAGDQVQLSGAGWTERGCEEDLAAFEDRVFRILSGGIMSSESAGGLTVVGPEGWMTLERMP